MKNKIPSSSFYNSTTLHIENHFYELRGFGIIFLLKFGEYMYRTVVLYDRFSVKEKFQSWNCF